MKTLTLYKQKVAKLVPSEPSESQEDLWKEVIDIYDIADRESYGYATLVNRLKERYSLTRKHP
jgi:hypothetical protein